MGRIYVDYGDSRIGLALSDPNKIIASPFKTIKNKGFDKTKKEIRYSKEKTILNLLY